MIVGYGKAPARLLESLRRLLIDNPDVYIYPEFFDSKRDLVKRKYMKYVKKVWLNRDKIIIALYPDYINKILNLPKSILYVYLVHELDKDSEFYEQLKQYYNIIPGYASMKKLRDYTIDDFCSVFNCKESWYLGANSREIYEAIGYKFWGVDITSLTIPGWGYMDNINADAAVMNAIFIEKLTKNTVLSRKQLYRIINARKNGKDITRFLGRTY